MTDTPTPEESAKDIFFSSSIKLEDAVKAMRGQREAGRRELSEDVRKAINRAVACIQEDVEKSQMDMDALPGAEYVANCVEAALAADHQEGDDA